MKKRVVAPGVAVLLMLYAAVANAQSTVVVLVRHAETAEAPEEDPVLSEAGQARAVSLAERLADAGVAAVFTTHYARTRETAMPLVTTSGAELRVVAVRPPDRMAHVRETAETIRRDFAGRTVLVVGHSNTLPALVSALGGPDIGSIDHSEHDPLFVLTMDAAGVRLVTARY